MSTQANLPAYPVNELYPDGTARQQFYGLSKREFIASQQLTAVVVAFMQRDGYIVSLTDAVDESVNLADALLSRLENPL